MAAKKSSPLKYIKNELYPEDAGGFMRAWRELPDKDQDDLKKWALEEIEAMED